MVSDPRPDSSLSSRPASELISRLSLKLCAAQGDRTVYVGNVDAEVDEATLRAVFENCGYVTQVRIAGCATALACSPFHPPSGFVFVSVWPGEV